MSLLNSPLEVGLRCVYLLVEVHPMPVDLARLVILDHALLHTADLDGPPSLHPALPNRISELGLKRTLVETGLDVFVGLGMVEVLVDANGIAYRASENSDSVLRLIHSPHGAAVRHRAAWVASELGTSSSEVLRERIADVLSRWSEEFTHVPTDGMLAL